MAIKSDKWIREMCKENQMISPFIDSQIKLDKETDRKLISFGLSSYGYDVRCSRKFKIFTNINSATVDELIVVKILSFIEPLTSLP